MAAFRIAKCSAAVLVVESKAIRTFGVTRAQVQVHCHPVPDLFTIYSIIGVSAVRLEVSINKICSLNLLFEGVTSTKIWNGHDDLQRSVLTFIHKNMGLS